MFYLKVEKRPPRWGGRCIDMGATYDRAMIDLERKAVEDVGLDYGWMLWNPNNVYLYQWFAQ